MSQRTLALLAFAVVLTIAGVIAALGQDHALPTNLQVGRFELYGTTVRNDQTGDSPARIFKIDTTTGRVWLFNGTKFASVDAP